MKLSDEQLADFDDRINTWIAKQGLFFHLTHGGAGLGQKNAFGEILFRGVLLCLLFFSFIVLIAAGFLAWKATGDELPDSLTESMAKNLGVSEVKGAGFKRTMTSASFRDLYAKGTEETFFEGFQARRVQFNMGLTDGLGLGSTLDTGKIFAEELTIPLRAGAATEALAKKNWESFFKDYPKVTISALEVRSTNLSWGFSAPSTWGSIEGSHLLAYRLGNGWQLNFSGGLFSQGIFRNFEISKISATLSEVGTFVITEASLKKGDGTITWSGKMTEGGATPIFNCSGSFDNLMVSDFIPKGLASYFVGAISGTLAANGSPNDRDGIRFQIEATPSDSNPIGITHEFALLQMISALDPQNSYRKLVFNEGVLKISTRGDKISFNNISLLARDEEDKTTLAKLEGAFSGAPADSKTLRDKRLALGAAPEVDSATVAITPVDDADLQEQLEKQFSGLQFANKHKAFRIISTDAEGEELKADRIDAVPRRLLRKPFVLDGELSLSVSGETFPTDVHLPNMQILSENGKKFAAVKIPLDGLVSDTSQSIFESWKEAMDGSGRPKF